jgi:hypothetical protein|tara:strand:- start:106 stop:282 length:177 start_codon:yes stop_codon:yes gene_type:complete
MVKLADIWENDPDIINLMIDGGAAGNWNSLDLLDLIKRLTPLMDDYDLHILKLHLEDI